MSLAQKGIAALGCAVIVFGIGYFTRYQYFTNPAGVTFRTNRWTEETDALSNGGWRIVQTHEQLATERRKTQERVATEQWMEKHPGEIPEDAKPWVHRRANCHDGTCVVYVQEYETITNDAAKQWVEKYKTCKRDTYNHYDSCTVVLNSADAWLLQQPLPAPTPVPTQ